MLVRAPKRLICASSIPELTRPTGGHFMVRVLPGTGPAGRAAQGGDPGAVVRSGKPRRLPAAVPHVLAGLIRRLVGPRGRGAGETATCLFPNSEDPGADGPE